MGSFHILRANRRYLALACALFFLGTVLGLLLPHQMENVVSDQLKHLKDIAQQTQAKNSPVYTSTVILINNLKAAAVMVVIGVPYAFMTAGALLINGLMVGVVFAQVGMKVSLLKLVLFGLVPHGIFELPAIFIASAFGIKLGRMLLVPLEGKTRWDSMKYVLREVLSVSWIVIVLLVVAASVEGSITPMLIHTFVSK